MFAICLLKLRGGYNNKPSIFDKMKEDDLIMAFFPCVRFENQIMLWFRGQNNSQKNWTDEHKMKYDMKLLDELKHNYDLVNKLFILCQRRRLKLIFENPYSEEHFLRRYWCMQPSIIDMDRRERGDYFKKPTQYWFVNCKPQNNIIFEVQNWNAIECKDAIRKMSGVHYKEMGAKTQKTARSMIHPNYANRFIREFILDKQRE